MAQAAEQLGFVGALTPTGILCEDAWLSTAMLCDRTERLKFLVAFRPGFYSPTLAAQMAATFQRHSQGRLLVNVVTGGERAEQRSYGDFLDKEGRYARTGEFLTIVSDLWAGKQVDFKGLHLAVEAASLVAWPQPIPLVYFGGSSPSAMRVAARHADVYLTWGEPPEYLAAKLHQVREQAASAGRTVRFGLWLHVITRDRADQAWSCAAHLLEGLDPGRIAAADAGLASSESEGQHRTACGPCTGDRPPTWRSRPICGPAWAWFEAVPELPWSAATARWETGSWNITPWASTSSSCPDTPISRWLIGSAKAFFPSWPAAATGGIRCPQSTT